MTNDTRRQLASPLSMQCTLPPDDEQTEERCADLLLQLVADAQTATTMDSADVTSSAADPGDAPTAAFYGWLAQEARACQSMPERRHDAENAAMFATRLVAARRTRAIALPVASGAPVLHPVDAPSVIGAAVHEHGAARYAPWADFAVAAGTGRDIWDEPTTTVIALPDGVPAGSYLALAVHGDSMRPLLHPGDTLLVKRESEWRRGALVVAHRPEHGYVVKQVGQMTASMVELTSFNAEYPPVLVPRDGRLLVGSVVLRWCPHGP